MSPKQVSLGLQKDELANNVQIAVESLQTQILGLVLAKPKKGEMAANMLKSHSEIIGRAVSILIKDSRFSLFRDYKKAKNEAQKELLIDMMKDNINEMWEKVEEAFKNAILKNIEEIVESPEFLMDIQEILEKYKARVEG